MLILIVSAYASAYRLDTSQYESKHRETFCILSPLAMQIYNKFSIKSMCKLYTKGAFWLFVPTLARWQNWDSGNDLSSIWRTITCCNLMCAHFATLLIKPSIKGRNRSDNETMIYSLLRRRGRFNTNSPEPISQLLLFSHSLDLDSDLVPTIWDINSNIDTEIDDDINVLTSTYCNSPMNIWWGDGEADRSRQKMVSEWLFTNNYIYDYIWNSARWRISWRGKSNIRVMLSLSTHKGMGTCCCRGCSCLHKLEVSSRFDIAISLHCKRH